jgi:hypothetical protein
MLCVPRFVLEPAVASWFGAGDAKDTKISSRGRHGKDATDICQGERRGLRLSARMAAVCLSLDSEKFVRHLPKC